jgi:26S proteasome regulatory subunit T5
MPAADDDIFGEADDDMGDEVAAMTDDELIARTRLLDNEIKVMRNESTRLGHEHSGMKEKIKENNEKIKLNRRRSPRTTAPPSTSTPTARASAS